ncbi:hypothetical protein [Pelagicoccus mobilis]|nr:hypothetical protein [Pelagicoccus mobilis]
MRWTWALVVAVLVHISLYWGVALTRSSDQALKRQARQFTEIQYFDAKTAERSIALGQQMTLFDPRPLLLPTEWNASNVANLLGTWQEEAEIFPPFPQMFELKDGNYVDDFGNVPAEYDRLSSAQVEFVFPPFRELGRRESSVGFEDEQGMSIVLVDPLSGSELSRTYIYNEAVMALEEAWPERGPSTFMATVEDSFHVGGLAVLASSGFDEADRDIGRIAYANFARLGALDDGIYLLEIVP